MTVEKLSGCQVRAARAMLSWSVRQLARASDLSESSVRRIESSFDVPENVSLELLLKIRAYLESRGFHFIFNDLKGPGVQWRFPTRERRRRGNGDRRGGGGGNGPVKLRLREVGSSLGG